MKPFSRIAGTAKRLVRDDSGAALLLTLAVFLLLFILLCGVFSVGQTIRQKVELQNACDAAAYSAAVVQADALSRMAVVNRALAWSYIQLCRAQMDYIVYRWLELTCARFDEDRAKNACNGGLFDLRHCFIPDAIGIGSFRLSKFHEYLEAPKVLKYVPVFRCHKCHHDSKNPGPGWYVGLPEKPGEVKGREKDWIKLNERDEDPAKDYRSCDALMSLLYDDPPQGLGEGWRRNQEVLIENLKETIRELNKTLPILNIQMQLAMAQAVRSVLESHLPQKADGGVDEEEAKDYYWMCSTTWSDPPAEYDYGGEGNGYFAGLVNTEEDELQFLSMAGGVPPRRGDAPTWMKGRPVYLSDYFGAGDNPTEPAQQLERYVAGGLDQWYVRGSRTEAANASERIVPKTLEAGNPQFDGGIRRVYKNSNRQEGYTEKILQQYYRPNHVFSGDIGAIQNMDFTEYVAFFHPGKLAGRLAEALGGRGAQVATEVAGYVFEGVSGIGIIVDVFLQGVADLIVDQVEQFAKQTVVELLQQLQSQVSTAVFDIAPSASHQRIQYVDQCANVAERVGLVAEYEWASAYWLCFYWDKRHVRIFPPRITYKRVNKSERHLRLPIRELLGCQEFLGRGASHGYGTAFPLSWIIGELRHLWQGGDSRNDYRSCFINVDGTRDYNYNTHLKGYARIYGDDAAIWSELGHVGEVAKPWVLRSEFFNGSGTIMVGLAKKQRNPFERLAETVVRPSLYEPFTLKGDGGRDRYTVALSAARAGYAPRPEKGDGTGTVNADGKAPGVYEARFDRVCFQKMKLNPEGDAGHTRLGCACGDEKNTERLARAWNLSQTDWDAMLLPVRFARGGHTDYDSVEPSGSQWEYDAPEMSGTSLTMDKIRETQWNQMVGGDRKGYMDILAFPPADEDGESDDPDKRLEDLLFRRKLL